MRKSVTLGAAIAAFGFVGAANAADMPTKMPMKAAPMMAPVYNWSGWYVGLNAGGAWGTDSLSSVGTPVAGAGPNGIPQSLAAASTFNVSPNEGAFIGGVQFGYNWQAGTTVYGIETDFQGLSKGGSSSITTSTPVPGFPAEAYISAITASKRVDYLGTLRGRLGTTAISPALFAYVTGGLAYGRVSWSNTISAFDGPGGYTTPAVMNASGSAFRAGWTVGVGGEWKLTPDWSIKGEYLYYDLGTVSGSGVLTQFSGVVWGSSSNQISTSFRGNIVRVGLNYQFH